MVTHKDVALHRGYAVTDWCQQVNLEDEGVARYYLLTELHVVNLHEVCRPTLRFLQGVQYEQSATLCHSFDLQDTGHDRLFGEVPLEEGLVGRNILDAYNRVGT